MTSNNAQYRQGQKDQKRPQPAEQLLEIVRRARQHRVDGVAGHAFEVIANHSEVMLEMADDAFNPGAATETMFGDSPFMRRCLPRGASWHVEFPSSQQTSGLGIPCRRLPERAFCP